MRKLIPFFFFSFFIATSGFTSDLEKTPSPSTEEILSKTFLVHAFPISPLKIDLIMKADSCVMNPDPVALFMNTLKDESSYIPQPDSARPCIYFSLNTMINDHSGIIISNRKFATILPFTTDLAERTVNFSPSDTAILGSIDLKKSPGALLFIPEETDTTDINPGHCKLIPYKGSLLDAVSSYITSHMAWKIDLIDAPEGEECSYFDRAMLEGRNVNTPTFYGNLLESYPLMSFGQESAPMKAVVANHMSNINKYHDLFLRLYSVGVFKKLPQKPGSIFKNFQTLPFAILMQKSLDEFENQLKEKAPKTLPFLTDVKKGRIETAIKNLTVYHNYKNNAQRPMSLTSVYLWLSDADYNWVTTTLQDNIFQEQKDTLMVAYCFNSIVKNACLGIDSTPHELKFNEHINRLKASRNTTTGKLDYNTAWLMNTVGSIMGTISKTQSHQDLFKKSMQKLRPIFQNFGIFEIESDKGQYFNTDIRPIFNSVAGLEKNYWKQGKKVPVLRLTDRKIETVFQ